ncbi:hypothetical protein SAMN04488600_11317, partial [Paenibacillus polymyxa]
RQAIAAEQEAATAMVEQHRQAIAPEQEAATVQGRFLAVAMMTV